MKLGAVMIPATTLLGPRRPGRPGRARRRQARGRAPRATPAEVRRACQATTRDRRRRRRADGLACASPTPRGRRRLHARRPDARPTIRCSSTSPRARRRSPSSCCTRTRATRSGHLSTMYWIGLQPGDVHLNISSPGWAKHAWSCFFAPWNAGASVFLYNYARFDAPALLDTMARCGVTTLLRPADRVAHAHPGGPARAAAAAAARAGRRRRAAQPRGHRAGAGGLGHHDPRRLRPDRDHRADRQRARAAGEAGLDGPAAAGLHGRAARRRRAARPTRARSASTCRARPLGLMVGYLDDPSTTAEVMRGGSTTPATSPSATPTATSPTSAAPTTCSRRPTTGSARSSWRAC